MNPIIFEIINAIKQGMKLQYFFAAYIILAMFGHLFAIELNGDPIYLVVSIVGYCVASLFPYLKQLRIFKPDCGAT